MENDAKKRRDARIDSLIQRARRRLPRAKAADGVRFLGIFYARTPPPDLLSEDPENLLGAALSMWGLGLDRQSGEARIRVSNPRMQTAGWDSPHTVIEIVNDDMPFLVDSVTSALSQQGLTVHLVIHPIYRLTRRRDGRIVTIHGDGDNRGGETTKDRANTPEDAQTFTESFMHVQIAEQLSSDAMRALEADLAAVLTEVRAAVEDWQKMRARMVRVLTLVEGDERAEGADTGADTATDTSADAATNTATNTATGPDRGSGAAAGADRDDIAETGAFLRWLEDNHFTFLGYREYNYSGGAGREARMTIAPNSGLGILRDPDVRVFENMRGLGDLPADVRGFLLTPRRLMIMKANIKARVHRPVHLDSISVKKIDAQNRVVGEHRFLGLFTSSAYNQSPGEIPLLRRKLATVIAAAGFRATSHDGKTLENILETFPRDELFLSSDEQLLETAVGIMHMQERPHSAAFVRIDPFERYASCIVYIPRDRFSTNLRVRITRLLAEVFNGRLAAHYTWMLDSPLVRIHTIIGTTRGAVPRIDPADLNRRLEDVCRSWLDRLLQAVIEAGYASEASRYLERYGAGFPSSYRAANSSAVAVRDIALMERLGAECELTMDLYRSPAAGAEGKAKGAGKGKDKATGKAKGKAVAKAGSAGDPAVLNLKLFRLGQSLSLSDVMPMLENMGVRVLVETPHKVRLNARPDGLGDETADHAGDEPNAETQAVWIHDFNMRLRDGSGVDLDQIKQTWQEAFGAVLDGRLENDRFNELVLKAGLDWREVSVLRAYAKYLQQAGFTFSQNYIAETLAENAAIARLIIALFRVLHDPAGEGAAKTPDAKASGRKRSQNRKRRAGALTKQITEALNAVDSLDQDRILRRFLNLVESTLRCNFFQTSETGAPKAYISFKLDSQALEDLPAPRPLVEIWVYSPRLEGIHLRGGTVARGGIRWSDRREDFRTEILGLMKAQMTKNAVIVPVGSKGGFVVKQPPVGGDRDAVRAEGVACYTLLMQGMLDLTDNIAGTGGEAGGETGAETGGEAGILPPADVVRHDGDDPYLVVAADKGTATFSDIANQISLDYGFWLGDAFASGGSAGYDHKKMGITARGAWESVKRHFRELKMDIQTTDFTVIGCGDMSGDVFGNGMLLSKSIRLLGAFNHLHIFLDPNPDAAVSWAERKRLFGLPRSTWADYEAGLISRGGGVFERRAKSITLTPEIKQMLGLEAETLTPSGLIAAMLKAEVDLLWFGGVGAYVKAADESNADVGDRANDDLRANGDEIRARVIGEGANLGITQRGRIACAMAGVRINTDAIDNSAGVNCSDHEVNIKILLRDLIDSGALAPRQRNRLLRQMTDAVADLVLRDNYDQSQAITLAEALGPDLLDTQARLIRRLEREDQRLDREIEFLPDDEALTERASGFGQLTRPEAAILLAYSKMALYDELLASSLPDDPALGETLMRYFPNLLQKRHPDAIARHRLRREIIATRVTNMIINRLGASFVYAVQEQTGDQAPDVARAALLANTVFSIDDLWGAIEALDNQVPAALQTRMLLEVHLLASRATLWFLRHEKQPIDLTATAEAYGPGIAALRDGLDAVMSDFNRADIDRRAGGFAQEGAPAKLARAVGVARILAVGCDLVRLARKTGIPVDHVASIYYALGQRFSLEWLRDRVTVIETNAYIEKVALATLLDDLSNHQIALAGNVLSFAAIGKGNKRGKPRKTTKAGNLDAAALVDRWLDARPGPVGRTDQLVADLRAEGSVDLATLTVISGQIRTLATG